ncbi:MAG: amidohydrolase family protein [Deltaproteobacteria bacterium]|nr:amidohydrolase family protein [Deltaproteobacteria bacterium]
MKINCHCHIFSLDCVPLEFRKRFVLDVKNSVHRFIHRLLRIILPNDSNLQAWIDLLDLSISEIAHRLVQEMDEAGMDISTPLMMDMEFCKGFGGGATKSFQVQANETIEAVESVNRKYGRTRLYPFIAADPNREGVVDIVIDALKGGVFKGVHPVKSPKGGSQAAFHGVKIYPVMGFTPDDKRLYPIYEYCMDSGIPITAHCENGGIPGLDDYYHLAHPKYWGIVLNDFPGLKLNLAHNDRTGSPWQPVIADLIMRYPNVYTDCSYDTEMMFIPRKYFRSIKQMLNTPKIQDRLLYGTDWYMGRCFWTEKSYLKWFTTYSRRIPWCRVEFTGEEIKRMTEDTPCNLPSPLLCPFQNSS